MAEASGAAPGAEQDAENDEGGGTDSEGGESSDLELDDSSISGQLAIFLRTSGFDEKLFAFLHAEADALEIAGGRSRVFHGIVPGVLTQSALCCRRGRRTEDRGARGISAIYAAV